MYALLLATESSYSASNAPNARDIEQVIREAMVGSDAELVGARARITRVGGLLNNLSGHPGNSTTVAWLVRANGPRTIEALKPRWDRALRRLSADWSAAEVLAFPTANDATVAWWQDQQQGASVTRTRDSFAVLNTDARENPTGPTTAADHPSTLPEVVQTTAQTVATVASQSTGVQTTVNNAVDSAVVKAVVAVVAVVVVVTLAGVVYKLYAPPRPNPARRHRRR